MKNELLDRVAMALLRKGFTVKILPRKWFDIVARRESSILIIKVLSDANSISQELADEMKKIGSFISGSPLIIAERAGELLEDGVVYSRFGIYTISLATFSDCINERLPFVIKGNSGMTVRVSGERLSQGIQSRGYSLTDISRRIGVSKQMIVRYKVEKSEVSLKKAEVLHRMFGEAIFEKVNVFSVSAEMGKSTQSGIAKKFEELGFSAVDTRKAPFDVIAKGKSQIILTEVGDSPKPELSSITKLIEADNLIIFDSKKPKEKTIPHISRQSFLDIETEHELTKFLREFE